MLPVRRRGLISLKGRWNVVRVICAYAVSAWDSQLPAAKQKEELFSTWPRVMVWQNAVSSCQISAACGQGFPVHSQLLSPFFLT